MAVDKELYREVSGRWRAGKHVMLGAIALAVLLGGVGAWSALASIAGAVVATGQLKVESNRQVVEHLDGGVVKDILVKEGDVVEPGQILIRLDDKLMAAELSIVEGQLYEIMARRGRLIAERDELRTITYADELREAASRNPEYQSLLDGQSRLFEARRDTAAREKEQLRERQTQIEEEILGAQAQSEALNRQLEFVGQELTDLRGLLKKGLAQASRVLALERENARLLGQVGELKATVAQLKGQISEIEIQLLSLESTRREEAITQLRDFEYRSNELRERRNSLLETLDRLDIRAPRPGRVLGLTIHALRS
ncbi:MAG: biotin/lipoyl-binding protein, partial [Pseudomonadota bacterium]